MANVKDDEYETLDFADEGEYTDDPAVRFVHPTMGPVPGYVTGDCGHRVAESEWCAGFRTCEHCPTTI